jgi:hypothetical protein
MPARQVSMIDVFTALIIVLLFSFNSKVLKLI